MSDDTLVTREYVDNFSVKEYVENGRYLADYIYLNSSNDGLEEKEVQVLLNKLKEVIGNDH